MTLTIGCLLLAVFLAFAALMFLERLSALLALPLMAVSFVTLAVLADLASPNGEATSRFRQWRELRRATADAVRERLATHARLLDAARAALASGDAAAIESMVARERPGVQAQLNACRARLLEYPDFLSKPPEHPGARALAEARLRSVPVESLLDALDRAVRESGDAGDPTRRVQAVLDQSLSLRTAPQRWLDRNADSDGWRAALRDALAYVGGHLALTVRAGSLSLSATMIATLFGGMFAMYVRNLKIAERLVYWTAEFAGERPAGVALAVFLATALIFTSAGGLGTVMMLGTIILPILRSVGLSPVVGAGVFLIGIAMGGQLHPVSRRLWLDFYGVTPAELDSILWTLVALYFATGVVWIAWGTRRGLRSSFQSREAAAEAPALTVPPRLMIAPLVPVALVYAGGIDEIAAFTIAICYMYLCVRGRDGATRQMARSLIDGAQAVVPPVLLMIGIGLLVTSLSTAPVQGYLRPLIEAAAPRTAARYVAVFALGAPLALYRGPLNVWGMGLAVSATLLATAALPPPAVLGAILAAGMLQGVCDPTNTANVWIAGFQNVGVNRLLRYLLLPVWAAASVAVTIFAMRFLA